MLNAHNPPVEPSLPCAKAKGLRESFKGFWSRPNRSAAWLWAADRFGQELNHAIDGSEEAEAFINLSFHAGYKSVQESRYARNQTK